MIDKVLAGVDIGGTKTAVVISFKPPQVDERRWFATNPERGWKVAVDRIIASLHEALASRDLTLSQLGAIGVSCGGPLDPVRGLIQRPPNLSTWDDVPICELLEQEFKVPCYVENDANAGALAEVRFGAGRGSKNLIFLTMGTGMGAGLILGGRLYRGASNSAGEIGHVRLSADGPIGFGKAGTVEGWASGGGMAQVARSYLEAAVTQRRSSLLLDGGGRVPENITGRDVAEALKAGDAVAHAVVNTVGERLGEAMAILIDVLNPECIVIGGLAMRFGEELLGPALQVVEREALGQAAKRCRIVPAGLGEQIGDVASLCVALRGSFSQEEPLID